MLPGSRSAPRALLLAGLLALVAPFAMSGGAALVPPLLDLGNPIAPQPCEDLCPDLTVAKSMINAHFGTINYGVNDCVVREGMAPPGPQRVVRFTTAPENIGLGDLVIGSPPGENFYFSACHGHYHTKDYADYRVWEPADYAAYQALRAQHPFYPAADLIAQLGADQQPVAGTKAGFCVFDLAVAPDANRVVKLLSERRFGGCGLMGISSGYADVYSSGIQGQWVVITGLAPGSYKLDIEVNPGHHYQELDYTNNSVAVDITVS